MRIAIPLSGGCVSKDLRSCELLRFYEDDHGRILRQFDEVPGVNTVETLERHGIDALLCASLEDAERTALLSSGIAVFPGYDGSARAAAERFLVSAVASDPSNTCNICLQREQCSGSCPPSP